jgi:hypothetical protein
MLVYAHQKQSAFKRSPPAGGYAIAPFLEENRSDTEQPVVDIAYKRAWL